MEKAESWDRNSVINQLTQGMELANKLKIQLHNSTNSGQACGFLVEEIVSCYDNALRLLNCMDFLKNALIGGSPRSEVSDQDFKDHVFVDVHKKRKTSPRWSEEVRLFSGTSSEGQLYDGYNWRKYGQKEILGSTHPRAYYRCTNRYTQGCLATKQIQRGEDDPSTFKVVYKGKHSCVLKQTKENVRVETNNVEDQRLLLQQMMISIEPGCKVETREQNPENVETQFFLEPTSDSYFSMSPRHFNDLRIDHSLLTSESYVTDMISNSTSATDFPPGNLDFLIDQVDFDSHFVEASSYISHVQDSQES